MKAKLLLLLLLPSYIVSAQFTVTAGTAFTMTNNAQLTLRNTDFINTGNFISGNSRVSFTGDASSTISGNPTEFWETEINKSNNNALILLQQTKSIRRILFTSGFLNLNGFNASLGGVGVLDGERENSRVIANNGGQVLFSAILNAPAGVNPGNLGLTITSQQDMGHVLIKRGHQSQNGNNLTSSILRYYELVPDDNQPFDATVRINYFDAELNNINENSLVFFKSDDVINWSLLGFVARSAATNFVERTGINSFSRFTLSGVTNPLPVQFVLFNLRCEGNKIVLNWKTAQEQNSSHFAIERSLNGANWTAIGNVPAAGNSAIEKSYSFTDNNPGEKNFYRVAEVDLDGRIQYTPILRSSCTTPAGTLTVSPNPFRDRVYINIVAANNVTALLRVYDSKGALVKTQTNTIQQGSNQLGIDMEKFASGIYTIKVDLNDGQLQQTVRVLKL